MTIPDGCSCVLCKHSSHTSVPRRMRPSGEALCLQTPLCGFELDPAMVEQTKKFMEKDPLKDVVPVQSWDKGK